MRLTNIFIHHFVILIWSIKWHSMYYYYSVFLFCKNHVWQTLLLPILALYSICLEQVKNAISCEICKTPSQSKTKFWTSLINDSSTWSSFHNTQVKSLDRRLKMSPSLCMLYWSKQDSYKDSDNIISASLVIGINNAAPPGKKLTPRLFPLFTSALSIEIIGNWFNISRISVMSHPLNCLLKISHG